MEVSGYKLIIECEMPSGATKQLYLDTCTEKSLSAGVQLATQPLQNGKTMADHAYSNPDEYTIRGTFSLYGNKHDMYDDFEGVEATTDRLTNIQNVFEYIMHNFLVCNLKVINEEIDGSTRFKARNNMVISNLSWTERESSMGYSITFREIYALEYRTVKVMPYDSDLPNVVMPSARSLGSLIVGDTDDDTIAKFIIITLVQAGYIIPDELELLGNYKNLPGAIRYDTSLMVSIASLSSGLVVSGSAIAALALGAMVTGIGLIIFAGAFLAVGALFATKAIDEDRLKKKADKIFHLIDNDDKYTTVDSSGDIHIDIERAKTDPTCKPNSTDLSKLLKVIESCKNGILQIADDCEVYQIANDKEDNDEREVIITVDNKIFFITISKANYTWENQSGWVFGVKKYNQNGDIVDLVVDSTATLINSNSIIYDLNLATDDNAFFTVGFNDEGNREYNVFIYCPNGNPYLYENYGDRAKIYADIIPYLCNYYLIVTKGSIADKIEKVYENITNLLTSLGYV